MDLSDEKLFLRVVQAGSLKAAAAQIGVDAATVSRRIAALEGRLGVALLQRSTRRTVPTEAGARYFQGLLRVTQEQDALEAEISGVAEAPHGRLRVTAPVDFGARFVVPAVIALRQQAPALEVELVLGSGALNLSEQGLDVAIRVGKLADSALLSRKLGVVPRVLVGGRGYLNRRGRPGSPDELAQHDFVLYSAENAHTPFELRGPEGQLSQVRPRGPCVVNSIAGIRALVAADQGLHIGPRWAFEDLLLSGEVEALLPDWGLAAYPLHALYAPAPYIPAKIRAFVDAMVRALADQPALQDSPNEPAQRPPA